MEGSHGIHKSVKIVNPRQQESDSVFWRSLPYSARLEALEQIRQEYHRWRYGVEPGFQRVYRIVQR